MRKLKTCTAMAVVLMALSSGTMVEAQGQLRGDREMREPAFIAAPTFTEGTGDGLGDHIATMPLNMSGFEIINVGDPSSDMSAVNLRTMTTAIAGARDNLGNHIATQALRMSGFEILEAGDPSTQTSVVNLRSMITAIEEGKDNLGNHIATEALQMSGFRIRNVGDPTHDTDVVNLRTMTSAIEAGRDNLGNHIATQNLRMEGFRIVDMADPQDPSDAATMRFVTDQIAAIPDLEAGTGIEVSGGTVSFNVAWGDGRYALRSRSITAGTGLTGGGDLSASRTIGFDTAWGDGRYALRTRTISAGDGLAGGGSLAENRTLSVDHTVVRTSGPQTIGGNKFFTDIVSFNNQRVRHVGDPLAPLDAVNLNTLQSEISDAIAAASLTAGTGITISGNEVSFDTVWGDGRYANHVHDQFGGTTYDAVLGGSTGATTFTHTQGSRPTDAPMDRQFSGIYISNPWGRAQIAMPNEFGVNTMFFRTGNTAEFWEVVSVEGNQTISGNKTFTGTTRFSGQRLIDVGTPTAGTDAANRDFVENAIGSAIAGAALSAGTGITIAGGTVSFDTAWGDGRYALRGRMIGAGDGLTGGGSLASDRTLSVDNTVVRTTGNQLIGGNKTFTGIASFSAQRLRNVGAPVSGTDAANRDFVENAIGSAIAGAALSAGTGITIAGGTVSFDTAWGDGRYALRTRTVNAGTGLTGGGSLAADRTINFDTAWGDNRYALRGRTISAGTGLTGGGTLAADRAIDFDTAWGDGRYAQHLNADMNGLSYDDVFGSGPGSLTFSHSSGARPTDAPGGQSSGIHIGNPWGRAQIVMPNHGGTVNRMFVRTGSSAGFSEVMMLDQDQTVAGNTIFSGSIGFSGQRLINVGSPTTGTDAANRDFVENAIGSAIAGATLSAGTGITIAGGTVSFDATWGDNRYALRGRTISAGDGLTGGGNLTANRTLSVDNTVVRTSGNQSIGGLKTFTGGEIVIDGGQFGSIGQGGFTDGLGNTADADDMWIRTRFRGSSGMENLNTVFRDAGGVTMYGRDSNGVIFEVDRDGNVWSGSRNNAVTETRAITVESRGFAGLHLLGDTDNVGGEPGGAHVLLSQDGGLVTGRLAIVQSGNEDGAGGTYEGTTTNSLLLGTDNNGHLNLGTNGEVRVRIQSNGITRFLGAINADGNPITNVPDPTAGHHAVNRNWVQDQIAAAAIGGGASYTAGSGIDISGGDVISVDNTVVRTTGNQTIGGTKTFTSNAGVIANGIRIGGSTNNYNGMDIIQLSNLINQYIDLDQAGSGWAIRGHNSSSSFRNLIAVNADGQLSLGGQASGTNHAVRADRSIATGDGLTGGGNLTANRTIEVDGTVVRTSGNQTIGGTKTFTGDIVRNGVFLHAGPQDGSLVFRTADNSANFIIEARSSGGLARFTVAHGADHLHGTSSGPWTIGGSPIVLGDRSVIAGTGLTGGGTLEADRTINFDTSWGDNRYALRTRTVSAGTGLTGGGTLVADRTINFDTSWGDNRYALRARNINAGTGLTGGGTLAADRTINFDTSWGDGRYAQHLDVGMSGLSYDDVLGSGPGATTFSHSMGARPTDAPMSTQASGIHVGNQWGRAQIVMPNHGGTVNRMFFRTGQSTDFHEVMSLEENQTVTGDKTFTGNLRVTQDPVHGNDVTRRSWVLAQIGALSGVSYTGVNGVAVDSGSNTISLTGQALAFHSLGSNGLVVRNGAGSAVARSIVGGDGVNVTNGNGVSGNPTLSLDNTVVRTTGNQTIGGNKTFTGLTRVTGRLIVEDPGMAQASPTITIGPGTGLGYHSNQNFQLALITNGTRRLMVTEDGDVVLSRQASANEHAVRADRNLIAGVGLTGGGNLTGNRTFALQNIAAGSTDQGAVWYNGTTRSPGRFYGGTQNPVNTETRLNFNGVLYATNFQANAYFHFSDERLKENIADLDRGEMRERLLGLRPVAYEMIETGESAMGLIAQEVREVFPGIVREADDEDGTLSVEYTQLISPMLSVIHDMDGELQAAQAENAELRALLGDMEARLAAIEEMLR